VCSLIRPRKPFASPRPAALTALSSTPKLTDAPLRAWLKKRPAEARDVPDGAVPGLALRLGPYLMTWSLKLRVTGEGGVTKRGRPKKGKTHRLTLGEYPTLTLEAARGTSNTYWDQAKRGISPVKALEQAATAGAITVEQLGKLFLDEYVKMRELRSFNKYDDAVRVHIGPNLGSHNAEMLGREDVRGAMKKVMVKKARGTGPRDRPRGGKEAARTFVSVLRQMITWGIQEKKLKRQDNPAANMEKNLPKKKRGERVLSLKERREAWRGAGELGYPFGPLYQLDILTGNRRSEWAKCKLEYLDLKQGLQIIPAASYKSDLIHVIPLVPQAVDILNWVLTYHPRSNGAYIFSGTEGEKPASGWTKAQKRMRDAICANTGEFPKPWTPHAIRRAVATDVAEATGESGDKLVKKVLGHAERGATEIYNRYRYVKEMRRVLAELANQLLATEKMYYTCATPLTSPSSSREHVLLNSA
jgi:integrase